MTDMSDNGRTLPTLTLNTDIDPVEPRVRDLDLAALLGMKNQRSIRELIGKNRQELGTYGNLSAAPTNSDRQSEYSGGFSAPPRNSSGGRGPGRPGTEYWLNEGQALLVCTLSRTPRAAQVRHLLITTYQASRREQRSLPPPPASPPAAEPGVCRGCAARRVPELAPITLSELELLRVVRILVASAAAAGLAPAEQALIDDFRALPRERQTLLAQNARAFLTGDKQ